MTENQNPILSVKKLTKMYPGTIALKNVDLDLYKGEVVAVVGENGAGKSTFIKILSGVIEPTEGDIFLNGEKVHLTNPKVATKLGISALHQELNLIDYLTVAQNIFLGNEKRKGIIPDSTEMENISKRYLKMFGMTFLPSKLVKDLSNIQKEIVQLCQALVHNAQILLFDEPTAAMEENDVKKLFEVIKDLKNKGETILYVSHKLSEVVEIADRTIVFRNGMKVGELKKNEFNIDRIVNLMAGRDIEVMKSYTSEPSESKDETILKVEHLTTKSVTDVSFELKKGEILGFAGLIGAGRSETVRALLGLDPTIISGDVYLYGKKFAIKNAYSAIRNGISYLPEERKFLGIFPTLSIEENLSISAYKNLSYAGIVLNKRESKRIAESYKEMLNIKITSWESSMNALSGGNQQKILLARTLSTNPNIVILDEPTRGVDVETKAEIYELMKAIVKQGKSIIMISSELDEVMNMSDRIVVMHEGKVVKIVNNKSRDILKEEIVSLMSGIEGEKVL